MTRYYHRTYHPRSILTEGFRDGSGTYLTANTYTGVWLSDVVLDCNDGANGHAVLAVDLDDEISKYEWADETLAVDPITGEPILDADGRQVTGMGYREWLVPATIVNRGTITLHELNEYEVHDRRRVGLEVELPDGYVMETTHPFPVRRNDDDDPATT